MIDGQIAWIRSVRAHLERLHAQDPKANLVIDAHPPSTTESLIMVMDSARAKGINGIRLADRSG